MGISGIDELESWERQFAATEALAEDLPEIAAQAIGAQSRSELEAGRSPAGDPFAPRKKDGGRALANAPQHVEFFAIGSDVVQDAPDHYKYHRTGTKNADGSQRMVKRNVYKESGALPPAWEKAADDAIIERTEKIFK